MIGKNRRTSIIGQKIRDYRIDIAALSETRLSEETSLEEIGNGYTFFWREKPDGVPRTSSVGFTIRTSYSTQPRVPPEGVSDRLMVLRPWLSR